MDRTCISEMYQQHQQQQQRWEGANKGGWKPLAKTWSAYIVDPPHYLYYFYTDVSCCLAGGEHWHLVYFRSYFCYLKQLFWPCGVSSQSGKIVWAAWEGVWEEEKLDLSCPLIEVGAHVSSQQLKAQWVQGERGPFKDQELRASTCRANYSVPKYQSTTQVPSTIAVPVHAKRLCTKIPKYPVRQYQSNIVARQKILYQSTKVPKYLVPK